LIYDYILITLLVPFDAGRRKRRFLPRSITFEDARRVRRQFSLIIISCFDRS